MRLCAQRWFMTGSCTAFNRRWIQRWSGRTLKLPRKWSAGWGSWTCRHGNPSPQMSQAKLMTVSRYIYSFSCWKQYEVRNLYSGLVLNPFRHCVHYCVGLQFNCFASGLMNLFRKHQLGGKIELLAAMMATASRIISHPKQPKNMCNNGQACCCRSFSSGLQTLIHKLGIIITAPPTKGTAKRKRRRLWKM